MLRERSIKMSKKVKVCRIDKNCIKKELLFSVKDGMMSLIYSFYL